MFATREIDLHEEAGRVELADRMRCALIRMVDANYRQLNEAKGG
jgi:hypothetical protein